MEGRRKPRHVASRVLSVALTAAVVVGVTLTLLATQHHGQTSAGAGTGANVLWAPLRILTGDTAEIYCPSAAAFSPDGTRIAVVGAVLTCGDAQDADTLVPHVLAIYDNRSGALLQSMALDPLIGVRDHASREAWHAGAVRYVALGWSPDGQHVGMVFAAFDNPRRIVPDDLLDAGFLLVDTVTGTGTVLHGDAGFFAAPTGNYAGLPVWDLAHGMVSPPMAPSPSLAYAWTPNGQPNAILPIGAQPVGRLPLTAGPRFPVGNPDGDATYTIWQPGIVVGPLAAPAAARLAPNEAVFVSWYPAWSPDGTAVTLMVTGVALPSPSGRADSMARPGSAADFPVPQTLTRVPARDAALSAVQQEVGAAGSAVVAWNPAGTLLASVDCSGGRSATLRLRAIDTGVPVGAAALQLGTGDPGCRETGAEYSGAYPNPNLWLEWSPNGSQMLVNDQTAGIVDVWSVSQPPA